jgi:hypothetical protein
MDSNDPRIRQERLHSQLIILPALEAWRELVFDGFLDGIPLLQPDWVASWLDEYASYQVAHLGLVRWKDGWLPLPLLHLLGRYFRVHFEDVSCEHCERLCGPSAAPDAVAYAGTGLTTAQAWAEFAVLPRQHCPHCGDVLRRRQTVWLAASAA